MKQVLQNFKSGELYVDDIPAPVVREGHVLVRNHYSLISSGTEGGTVKLGRMSLIGKAKARPEQVKKVFRLIRTDGVLTAWQAVSRSLDIPISLGYSSAGVVLEVGEGADGFRPGDRVACGGTGACHAEIVCVPRNLCVKVPVDVSLQHASFTTVGAIALQSLRISRCQLGENVVVIGLGLVGLLAVELFKSAGCRVLGIDVSTARVGFAEEKGFCIAFNRNTDGLADRVLELTGGRGADVSVIAAAAPSSDPVVLAGEMARHKGRVVVVGRTVMDAPRETYLFKELELLTSAGYGAGFGDVQYEEHGRDYPFAYVPWTENRNMSAFLDQVADGRVRAQELITHEYGIEDTAAAFDLVTGRTDGHSLAVSLSYPVPEEAGGNGKADADIVRRIMSSPSASRSESTGDGTVRVGVIGAGSFATNFMIPALKKQRHAVLTGIASARGAHASALARKHGFRFCTSDADEILNDPETDCIFVLTRHNLHAPLAVKAMEAGKHVFVEKPLAMTEEELDAVVQASERTGRIVQTGFNRRFAPMGRRLHDFFAGIKQPINVHYRANVGYRPPEHWLHDPIEGGGVLLGEACHFVDFCQFMINSEPVDVTAKCLSGADRGLVDQDNFVVLVSYADGSLATVSYMSCGDTAMSRERVEVFGGGKSGVMEDFSYLCLSSRGKSEKRRSRLLPDRGFAEEVEQMFKAIADGLGPPTPFRDQITSTRITLQASALLSQ